MAQDRGAYGGNAAGLKRPICGKGGSARVAPTWCSRKSSLATPWWAG